MTLHRLNSKARSIAISPNGCNARMSFLLVLMNRQKIIRTCLHIVATTVVIGVQGCTSEKTITGMGTSYKQANQAAIDAVSIETNQVKRVRRIAAIVAYINNPDQKITANIDRGQLVGSFANFVCTGSGDIETTRAGLKYTADYAAAIQAITKAPNDSISGYIAALENLKGQDKVLAVPKIQKNPFNQCREEVVADLPPVGFNAVTGQEEAVGEAIAAYTAIQTLISAVKTLAKESLKVVTEAQQRQVLKSFIEKNQSAYTQVLTEDLSSNELAQAFERRRKTTIALPYYSFIEMLRLSTATDKSKIILAAAEVDKQLTEYDAIRTQPKPAAVAEVFKTINQQLQDYANNKVSFSDLVEFLSETADEVAQLTKDYDAVLKGISSVDKAIGGK